MLIGILSDTHGRFEAAKMAIDLLRARKAEYIFHCGDVGSEAIIDLLAGDAPLAGFVFGNNDNDRQQLAAYAKSLNVICFDTFGEIELDGKRIAITHGDHPALVRNVITQQSADYLFVGHTHVMSDRRAGRVRMINPGALYRTAVKSVALLDTQADRLEFLRLVVPSSRSAP